MEHLAVMDQTKISVHGTNIKSITKAIIDSDSVIPLSAHLRPNTLFGQGAGH